MISNRDHLLPTPGNSVPDHKDPHTVSRTKNSMNTSPGDNRAEVSSGPEAASEVRAGAKNFIKAHLHPVARNKPLLR